ncbi:MAG: hypothetical protein ABJA75_02370 [Bradyrhizobium sp.]
MGQVLVQTHRLDEAIAEFQKAIEMSGHSGVFDSNLAYAYALAGRKDEATIRSDARFKNLLQRIGLPS